MSLITVMHELGTVGPTIIYEYEQWDQLPDVSRKQREKIMTVTAVLTNIAFVDVMMKVAVTDTVADVVVDDGGVIVTVIVDVAAVVFICNTVIVIVDDAVVTAVAAVTCKVFQEDILEDGPLFAS